MPRMDKLSNYKTNVTVTTKRKMNQTANQFGLEFGVHQKNFTWFVTTPLGDTIPFKDGMKIRRVV